MGKIVNLGKFKFFFLIPLKDFSDRSIEIHDLEYPRRLAKDYIMELMNLTKFPSTILLNIQLNRTRGDEVEYGVLIQGKKHYIHNIAKVVWDSKEDEPEDSALCGTIG